MAHTGRVLLILAVTAVLGVCLAIAAWGEDPATRVGTIDRVTRGDGGIFLDVTIQGELAQPLNPQLSTGVPDPSQVMDPGATQAVQVAVGMPVKLVIVRQGAVFRFTIGTVDSMDDKTHCRVKVDPGSLNQTFQDPADDNSVRSLGDFLKVGAYVAIWGVRPAY